MVSSTDTDVPSPTPPIIICDKLGNPTVTLIFARTPSYRALIRGYIAAVSSADWDYFEDDRWLVTYRFEGLDFDIENDFHLKDFVDLQQQPVIQASDPLMLKITHLGRQE